jgi:parallel beta-helix repeat protein
LFVGVNIVPTISGSIIKINSLDNKKTELNSEYINSYNTPVNANNLISKENSLYVITNEFGLHEYTYKNPNSNYDQSDKLQSLKFRKVERLYRGITTKQLDNNFNLKISGNIFYVGGSGPNNYTHIQDAIENASNGDTVFVYDDSSPYYENILIDKSIHLIGENKESTVINGSKLDIFVDTINITADNVNINGFSINENAGYYYQAAILITGDHATVSNCKIYNNNWIGISLLGSSYSQISFCELFDNLIAIHLVDSNENEIKDCLCHENTDAISLFENSHNNKIVNCTCIGNSFDGIHIQYSSENQIINCTVQNGYDGIGLAFAPNTKMRGNIMNNNNENFAIGSSSVSDFYCDIDTSNTINGKPIYYWLDHHDEQVPSDAAFIGLINCTNILVKDLEMTNNFQGIVCADTSNSTIENCNFYNNGGHGIFFVSSSNNTISNCSCVNSFFSGIYLSYLSNSNIIYNNTLTNINICGIWVEESTSNKISKHVISNCISGISLDKSGNSVLRNNDMINCGLAVDGTSLFDYINDVDTSNTVNGKILYYYIDTNDLIVSSDAGQVVLVNCTNCNISDLELNDGTIGVELAFSSNNIISGNIINGNNKVAIDLDCSSNNYNTIKGNNIINNNYGIDVDLSDHNTFQDNIVHDNGVAFSLDTSDNNDILENDIKSSYNGIYLSNSNNNKINNNIISKCGFTAIYLLYSKNNILKNNEMENCGLIVYGTSLSEYINDVDTSNKVNGKPLYYYMNENDITVPSDASEVILINCDHCVVSDLNLSDGTVGVELAYSNYNTISKNTLNNNKFASIYLESSSDNTVKTNNMENNGYGISMQLADNNDIKNNEIQKSYYGCFIYLSNSNIFSGNNILYNTYGIRFNLPSTSNSIHHNNLIYNGYNAWDENENTNAWDDGKKGNYWGDYTQKYPNARRIWLKGIWNTPYEIPSEENQDRYPLILPCISFKEKTANLIRINLLEKILDYISILKTIFKMKLL